MEKIFEQRSRIKTSEYTAPELLIAGIYDWFFYVEDAVEAEFVKNYLIFLGENEEKVVNYMKQFRRYKQ